MSDIVTLGLILLGVAGPVVMQLGKWLAKYPLSRWLPEVSGTLAEVVFAVLSGLLAAGWLYLNGQLSVTGSTPLELASSLATAGLTIWGVGTAIYTKFKLYIPGPKTL